MSKAGLRYQRAGKQQIQKYVNSVRLKHQDPLCTYREDSKYSPVLPLGVPEGPDLEKPVTKKRSVKH